MALVITLKTDQVPPLGAGIDIVCRENGAVQATYNFDRTDFDAAPDWDQFQNGALQLIRSLEKELPNALFEAALVVGIEVVLT